MRFTLSPAQPSAVKAIHHVRLAGHTLDDPTSIQAELRAFHVPRNRTVELPVELRLDRCRESLMSEIPVPKHLEDRPLHRFILCPANFDSPLSMRCNVSIFSSMERREKMSAI